MNQFFKKITYVGIKCACAVFVWMIFVFQSYSADVDYSPGGCLRNVLDLGDNDVSSQMTSKEAILKSYLLPIDLENPIADAKQRISHGDYRFIGLGTGAMDGFYVYPALDKSDYSYYLCTYGKKLIEGTGEHYDNDEHKKMGRYLFWQYAQEYNQYLLDYVQNIK